jgi:signal peptidase I
MIINFNLHTNKKYKRFIKLIFFPILLTGVVLLRIYVFDIYKVPSPSMQDSIEPGDYILVSKISYGPRVMDWWELLVNKKVKYNWYNGLGKLEKGDVVVFNKPANRSDKPEEGIFKNTMIKRCSFVPGDTVRILNSSNNPVQRYGLKPNLFPHDSCLNWTLDNFGPLWVPKKGKVLLLDSLNLLHYKQILLNETCQIKIRNDSAFINNWHFKFYTFRYNYYFMQGDNFYQSFDSRYWGFVPQSHIIGKAVLVLFSLDPNEPWYRSFKWKRFLKRIK